MTKSLINRFRTILLPLSLLAMTGACLSDDDPGGEAVCELTSEVECCSDSDCTDGTCDIDTSTCAPDLISCTIDEDCAEGTCNLDTSTCETVVACAVEGDVECCEDADCTDGTCDTELSTCTPNDTCVVEDAVECCSDEDCSEGTCDTESATCVIPALNSCDTCDPTNDTCEDGFFCNTYGSPATGETYYECAPALVAGEETVCDDASNTGGSCDATTLGNICQQGGIFGTVDVTCTCDGYWSQLQATNEPPPPALNSCDTCDPANDTCGDGLYCNTYGSPATGETYYECAPALVAGEETVCDDASNTGGSCDATTLGNICQQGGIFGTVDVTCTCDGYWSQLQDSPQPGL